jgi:undecaprenyl-diphosphatase
MEEKKLQPFRGVGIELILGCIFAFFLLGTFAKLSSDILHQELESFDTVVGEFIRGFHTEWLTGFFIVVTDLGDKAAYVLIVCILLFVFIKFYKQYLQSIFLLLAVLGSWGLNEILKGTFQRARPEIAHLVEEDGYSFPSGHAMVALATYGIIGYIIWTNTKENGIVAWFVVTLITLLILSIGLSRIYLGVHYPSDVIAGYSAGAVWLLACIYGMRMVSYYQGKKGERLK